MSLLDEARAMSPEEQVELGKLLQSAEIRAKYQGEKVRQLGEPMHGPGYSQRLGKSIHEVLTPEEIYIFRHPIEQRQYGYCEISHIWGQEEKRKYWSKEEVDAYNEERKLLWLGEARKKFPDITLPDEETMRHIEQYKDFF